MGVGRVKRHRAWAWVVLVGTVAVCWTPIWFMVVVASHDSAAATTFPPPAVPGPELASNVARVFSAISFGGALTNSVVVAASTAVGGALLCALAGFAFAKLRFRGRRTLFAAVLIGLTLPVQLAMIPSYLLVSALGWADSLQAVILPGLASAFGVFWMRQHIAATLPDDTLAAAYLDGCGPWGTFRHVAFPTIRPGVLVLAGILFVSAWSDFMWPFIVLRSPGSYTIQVALSALQSEFGIDYSLVFAGALLATVPVVALVAIVSRWMPADGAPRTWGVSARRGGAERRRLTQPSAPPSSAGLGAPAGRAATRAKELPR